MRRRYFVRCILDDGRAAILSHRNRTEWTKKTAEKYADEYFNRHGCVCYVVPA
jgi:hypothetical protein